MCVCVYVFGGSSPTLTLHNRYIVPVYMHKCVLHTSTASGYLQKEAIAFAWDVLVNVLKLPTDRLYVTYFGGNADLKLPPDDEAKQIWLDTGWVRGRGRKVEGGRERGGRRREGNDKSIVVCAQSNEVLFEAKYFPHTCMPLEYCSR